jgi:hypothetical protein
MYTLDDDGNPVSCSDTLEWSEWLALHPEQRVVEKTRVRDDDDTEVSTVFLGLDHGLGAAPLLWETMIFSSCDEIDQWQRRYASLEAAKRGHQMAVELARIVLSDF